ncbi:MAG: hypothetical protein OIF32_06475 [Campylobacterales bacterium]|nr:hypothetical protein [Campylobacterales bacterium]
MNNSQQISYISQKILEGSLERDKDHNLILKFDLTSEDLQTINDNSEDTINSLRGDVIRSSFIKMEDIETIDFVQDVGGKITLLPIEKRFYECFTTYTSVFPKIDLKIYQNEIDRFDNDKTFNKNISLASMRKIDIDEKNVKEVTLDESGITIKYTPEYLIETRINGAFGDEFPLSNILKEILKTTDLEKEVTGIFNIFVKKQVRKLKEIVEKAGLLKQKKNTLKALRSTDSKNKKKIQEAEENHKDNKERLQLICQKFQLEFENFFIKEVDQNHVIREKFKTLALLESVENQTEEIIQKSSILNMELYEIAQNNAMDLDKLKNALASENILPTKLKKYTDSYGAKLAKEEEILDTFDKDYIRGIQQKTSIDILDLNSFKFLFTLICEKKIASLPNNEDYINDDRCGYKEKFNQIFKQALADKTNINYTKLIRLANDILVDYGRIANLDIGKTRELISQYHGLSGDLTPVDTSALLKSLKKIKNEIMKVNELFHVVYDTIKFESKTLSVTQDIGIDAGEQLTEIGVNLGANGNIGFLVSDLEYVLNILSTFGKEKEFNEHLETILKGMIKINSFIQKDSALWTDFHNKAGMRKTVFRKNSDENGPNLDILSWEDMTEKYKENQAVFKRHRMMTTFEEKIPNTNNFRKQIGKIKTLRDDLTYIKKSIFSQMEKDETLQKTIQSKERRLKELVSVGGSEAIQISKELAKFKKSYGEFDTVKAFDIKKLPSNDGKEKIRVMVIPQKAKLRDRKALAQDEKAHTIRGTKERISNLAKWFSLLQDEIDENLKFLGGRRGDMQSGFYFELAKVLNQKEDELQEKLKELKNIKVNAGQDIVNQLNSFLYDVTMNYNRQSILKDPLGTSTELIPGVIPGGYFQTLKEKLEDIYTNKGAKEEEAKKEIEKFFEKFSPTNKNQITSGLQGILNNKIDNEDYDQLKDIVDKFFQIQDAESNRANEEQEINNIFDEITEFKNRIPPKEIENLKESLVNTYSKIKKNHRSNTDGENILNEVQRKIILHNNNHPKSKLSFKEFNEEFYRLTLLKKPNDPISYKVNIPKQTENQDKDLLKDLFWSEFKNSFIKLHKQVQDKTIKSKYTLFYRTLEKDIFKNK